MMQIEPSCVSELYGDTGFKDMVAEYILHSNPAMPPPVFKESDYLQREKFGVLDCWRVMVDGKLGGFMSIVTAYSLHFGPNILVVESLFVMKKYRMTGAGFKMVRLAKEHAKRRGAPVVVVQCPYGAPLAKLLEKEGFTPEILCYCFKP